MANEHALNGDMPERLASVSPSFCLAKWTQLTLLLQNGHNHSCHHPTTHKIPVVDLEANPSALHNTRYKKLVRSEMLAGKRPAECEYCWMMEDAGQWSDRFMKSADYWSAPYFQEVVDSGLGERAAPRYLEVAFENTCNFKCAYCTPQSSSRWLQEVREFGPYPTRNSFGDLRQMQSEARALYPADAPNPYVDAFWNWWPELAPKLVVFRITGGEPLLSRHTWRILESLDRDPKPHLEIGINTNLGVPTDLVRKLADAINKLEGKVKRVMLYASLDTVGKRAEYIRYGLDYELYQRNLRELLGGIRWRVRLTHMITVNALSLSGTTDLLRSIYELKREFPLHSLGVDLPYLRYPNFLSIQILPLAFADYLAEALAFVRSVGDTPEAFHPLEVGKVERLLGYMREGEKPRNLPAVHADFYRMFREYDRRRGLDFLATFPEYAEFWERCREAAGEKQPEAGAVANAADANRSGFADMEAFLRARGIQKPRIYNLTLSPNCAESCHYCAAAGMRARAERAQAGVVNSLAKAKSGPYGAILVPCNVWFLPARAEIFATLAASGFPVIAQVNSATLARADARDLVVEARRRGFILNYIFSDESGVDPAVLEVFRADATFYATFVVSRRVDIVAIVASLPIWVRDRLFFQFPFSASESAEFCSNRGIHRAVAALERAFPGFRVRPAPGLDAFDPRIADDRNIEPLIAPEFATATSAPVPRISVVIPTYNNRAYLTNVLRHLFVQDYPADGFEVIVVDDGSDDDTRAAARGLAEAHGGKVNFSYIYFPRPRPRRMGDDQFRAGVARNLGVKHARGEFLFFLDSDILLPPDALSRLVEEHRYGDVVQLKRLQLRREQSSQFTRYEDLVAGRDTYVTDAGYWERFQDETKDWMALDRPWRFTCTYALSLSRAAFDRIGWIRRNYIHYGYEDTELGFELYRAGYRFHLSQLVAFHLDHRTQRSEFFNSFRRKKLLLAKSAATFYRNTLDEGVYRHLDWLFLPFLGVRVWLGDFAPFVLVVLRPLYRIVRVLDDGLPDSRLSFQWVPYPLRKIYYFCSYQWSKRVLGA